MSTKEDEQGKNITANTVALKIRVPGALRKNLDRFIFFRKKGIELLTDLASFYIPLFRKIWSFKFPPH